MAWLARDISIDWLPSAPDEALVWFLGRLCPFFFAFYSLILTMCFHRVLFSVCSSLMTWLLAFFCLLYFEMSIVDA
jgi:hypothetical protein